MNTFSQILNFFKGMFQWWVMISPWEQGLRIRFGKYITTINPGIHFKLPFFDVVYIQPIRLRTISTVEQCLMTQDKKIVSLCGSISYKITDISLLYQTLHNPTTVIQQQVMGIISAYIHSHDYLNISQSELAEHVNTNMKLTDYGLSSGVFFLTNFVSTKTYRLINNLHTYTENEDRVNMVKDVTGPPAI